MTKYPLSIAPLYRGAVVAAFGAVACLGCAGQTRLAKTLDEKEQLVSRVADEMKRTDELKSELVESNRRAADAERQLARLLDPKNPAASKLAKGMRERSPRSDLDPRYANPVTTGESRPRTARGLSREVLVAAEKVPHLRFDERASALVFHGDLRFDSNDRPDEISKRRLDELAKFLQSPEGSQLRAEITGLDLTRADDQRSAGHARASSVAAYLWQRRVSKQRITVDSRSGSGLEDEDGRKLPATKDKVEVILVEHSAPSAQASVPRRPNRTGEDGNPTSSEADSDENWTPIDR